MCSLWPRSYPCHSIVIALPKQPRRHPGAQVIEAFYTATSGLKGAVAEKIMWWLTETGKVQEMMEALVLVRGRSKVVPESFQDRPYWYYVTVVGVVPRSFQDHSEMVIQGGKSSWRRYKIVPRSIQYVLYEYALHVCSHFCVRLQS